MSTRGNGQSVLVYLPSPLGDAVLCTPALRAIRERFRGDTITFLANRVVREVLSSCPFHDDWFEAEHSFGATVSELRKHRFDRVILFKNSFGSALTVFLAGIPQRIGYTREGRGFLLTDRLAPQRSAKGGFEPVSMVDYYLAIAQRLGAEITRRNLELHVDPEDMERVQTLLPEAFDTTGPLVVLVPGGAFGPSKCWPAERYAQTADWLAETCGATVVLSVAANSFEKQIAQQIQQTARHRPLSLADRPVSLGQLKALISRADLVIANDTGPRHMAIALGRKVVTLFGPNDPAWTQTGYADEVQIVGQAPCAPCQKPTCEQNNHACMRSIAVEQVCEAARGLMCAER